MKIAIQGIKGSFHHEAVDRYFGNIDCELLECETFRELAKSVANGTVDKAVMAIENTIAGTILPNFALLTKHQLKVIGEINISIQHQFMVLNGSQMEEIKEVRSHPMALLQCDKFLDKYHQLKIVESADTALSAKDIADHKWNHISAIASRKAAETYGLTILEENIQNSAENYTRFFILEKEPEKITDFDKVSLRFVTDHQQGALVKILDEISKEGINMEKIQSVPLVHRPWKYSFYTDITFDDMEQYHRAMHNISKTASELEILGEYKKGIR